MTIAANNDKTARKASKNGDQKEEVSWNMFNGLSVNFQGRRRERNQGQQQTGAPTTNVNRDEPHRKQNQLNTNLVEGSNTVNSRSFFCSASQAKDEERQPSTKKREWRILGLGGSPEEDDTKGSNGRAASEDATQPTIRTSSVSTPKDSSCSQQENTKQRHAVYRAFGGSPLESIRVEQETAPMVPEEDDHVVVKILASTICTQDCILRRGLDFEVTDPISLPVVPGQDFVGRLYARGNLATDVPDGALVAGFVRTGGNARFISVPAHSLIQVPPKVGPEEAVCLLSVYATAYQCMKLVSSNNLLFALENKRVLIVGGMDSVGQALLDMCRTAKAQVFVTAPDHRHALVKSTFGAHPLPEKTSEWSPMVEGEMDIVFDGVCHKGSAASLKSLKEDGTLVCFGQASLLRQKMGLFGAPLTAHIERLQTKFTRRTKVVDTWESYKNDPETYKRNIQTLFQLLKSKKIKPNITNRVGLDEVGLYHDKIETGQARGIIVCLPWKRVSKKSIFRVDTDSDRQKNKPSPIINCG
ncbi:hypothetical protein ACA910_022107 [Epithemia clementina (nom. ined.)]